MLQNDIRLFCYPITIDIYMYFSLLVLSYQILLPFFLLLLVYYYYYLITSSEQLVLALLYEDVLLLQEEDIASFFPHHCQIPIKIII